MFEHWREFASVLPEHEYDDVDHLISTFRTGVIDAVERWQSRANKSKALERQLREENEKKDARIRKLESRLKARRRRVRKPPM